MAELADALGSGSSGGNPVRVQVPASAPFFFLLEDFFKYSLFELFVPSRKFLKNDKKIIDNRDNFFVII